MQKKITLLFSFLLITFFTFGQEWRSVDEAKAEKEKDPKKVERGINPYRNAVDGIEVEKNAPTGKETVDYDITDSPDGGPYSNTLTDLGWHTFTVSESESIVAVQVDYTWTTDAYAYEGSFHLESPNGTSAVIASGQEDGTYSVVLDNFEGESLNGDWDIWIEDSFGDGGHQATDVTVTFFTPSANDAGINEILSIEEGLTFNGEKDLIVQLKNYGTDELTSANIEGGYVVNEDTTWMEQMEWTGSLEQGETEEVNLGSINLEAGKVYQVGAWTSQPNGVEDENPANDTTGIETEVYQKGSLIESFEYESFPPKNWKVVNNDGGSKEWMRDGNYSYQGDFSASVGYETPNDDWLITPKLVVGEDDIFSFWAYSTGSIFLEDFNVLVSKKSNDINDFTITLDEVVEHPNEWQQHSYNLTDNANISEGDEIYVAIQCVSDNQLRLAVDMFTGPMLAGIEDNDVAVNEVVTSVLKPGVENELEAVIQNDGINDQTSVEVTFEINGDQVGTATVDELTYQEYETVTVPWTAPDEPGSHTLKVFVSDDDNNDNNSVTKEIWSLKEQNSFVMDLNDEELLSMTLPDAQEIEVIGANTTLLYAGTWALGKWYAVSDENALLTVDTATGTRETIGTLELNSVTGLAYDWNSNTMYAMTYDADNEVSKLYTVDIETAEVEQVGSGTTPGININLACDLEGNLYSMNLDDKLYEISSSAGAGTEVGDLGININYAQDMEFDHANGDILYATAYTSEGGLYTINTETGEANLLGAFDEGNEYAGFAIPYHSPVPYASELYPANNSETTPVDTEIYVTFDQEIDSVDFSGITVTGENSGDAENISAELDGNTLIISNDPLENNDVYTVTIPAETVSAEEPNEEISWTFTSIMEAPETKTLSPENESEGVVLDADVSAIFDQKISDNNLASVTMTGNVQGDVTGVDATVHSDGKTVVIEHDDFTEYEDTITVNIPADAVVNEDGVGNENEIEWEFYTMNEDQPVADSLAPANNATGVALDADALIRFDKTVTANDLNGITITGENEGEVGNVEANLEDDDMTITITHDDLANNDELYTVTIPGGAVEASGEPNDEIKWNFTSIKTAPQLVEMVPADGENKVAPDEEINFSFDQEVDTDYDLDTMITIIGENEDTTEITSVTQDADEMGYTIAHNGMEYNNAEYTVTVPAELVYNSDEVLNEDEVTWTFTTIMAEPLPISTTPEPEETDVPLDAEVAIEFDQEIEPNDLDIISINSEAMGQVENVNATIEEDNKTITITHDDFFTENDDIYTVKIPSSTVMNNDGVYNSEIEWSFQTVYTYDITFQAQKDDVPVEEVTISMAGQEATTNEEGKATVKSVVKGGPYEYTATKDGYKTVNGSIDVNGEAIVPINLEEGYTVTFDVSDESENIEGATVDFNGESKTTDESGVAEFMEIEPGTKSYQVTMSGYDSESGTVTVEDGDVSKSIVMTESATNINELEKHGIEVYPNPTDGVFYITNKENAKMELVISDITGKSILKKAIEDSRNQINLSDYATGIYILQISRGEDTYSGKIILK
ncbi:MAG: Ig-like domain-containing protein [Bacteroidales bacterium]